MKNLPCTILRCALQLCMSGTLSKGYFHKQLRYSRIIPEDAELSQSSITHSRLLLSVQT